MAVTINMPKLGFDMAEGLLVRWVRQVGENINKGDVLAEIETDKATVEVESSASGVVLQHIVDQGTIVPVNAPIAIVGAAGEKVDLKPSATMPTIQASTAPAPGGIAPPETATTTHGHPSVIKASPLARKVAREQKVDLAKVHGTGPAGRIVRRDIEAALAADQAATNNIQPASIDQRPASIADEVIQTTKLRQAIGRRLAESKQAVPHFYVTHEYKMDALLDMRRQINAYLPEDEKVSVNDIILKAVALSLRQFPNLNAVLSGDKIIRRGQINVSVAVTVDGGLLTVVVRDTDQKTLRQIAGEVKTMASRARAGRVKPDDVDGSTFSTSNLGMYDVEDFIAIINPPEAAILAISSAREIPVVENGQVKAGWRMKATISVDHRVSDGAEAARFMQELAGFLENPVRMLL